MQNSLKIKIIKIGISRISKLKRLKNLYSRSSEVRNSAIKSESFSILKFKFLLPNSASKSIRTLMGV